MFKSETLKKSLARNTILWMFMWILVVLNILAIINISRGYSISRLIIAIIIIAIGLAILKFLSSRFSNTHEISAELYQQIADLMERIRPYCDAIFDKEIERITEPILGEIEQDYIKSMNWLWENNDVYLGQLKTGIAEFRTSVQTNDTIENSKAKNYKKIQESVELLLEIIDLLNRSKEDDKEEIEKLLKNKAVELTQGMAKEKEIFYDYIEKLLIQQIITVDVNIDINEYLNLDKLGDHFSVVIEKSIHVRLDYYKAAIIKDLEILSADIVGKMQKGAFQLKNIFSEIEKLIDLLLVEYRDEDPIMARRMQDTRGKISRLREEANDFLVTLAWQDILIEKRWQDIQVKLFILRDKVMEKVSPEVIQYMLNVLEERIPGYASMASNGETAIVYKACLDAEVVYQLTDSDKLKDIISDDVYSLLQFIRPVELLMGGSLRLSDAGIAERRLIKENLRQPEYLELWENVIQEVKNQKPELLPYIDNVFPLGFSSFCNSPNVKQKPENINDAAWSLFLAACGGQKLSPDGLLLIGLLLVINRLRNKYIHPLKGLPLPLEETEEIEYIRFCAYKSIEIFIGLQLRGIVRSKLN